MANQYGNNLAILIEQRFGKTVEELLNDLATQEMTYNDAAKFLSVASGTIRKYCYRYNVRLKPCPNPRNEPEETIPPIFYNKQINKFKANRDELELKALYTGLRSDRLNRINILSISWTGKKRA